MAYLWICVFILLCGLCNVEAISQTPNILKIGVIFTEENTVEELAVRQAVEAINRDTTILPNHQIHYISNYTGLLTTFKTIQKVCYQLKEGVTTIIGPLSTSAVKASYPMCQGFHVPMIAPGATDPTLASRQFYKYLLRMMPSDAEQSRALIDFINYFGWDTVAILSDNTDYGINGLLKFQTEASSNKWRLLSVQQFAATNNFSEVDATRQLASIKQTGARIVILNCFATHAVYVLHQARKAGMMQAGWVWIVTDGVTGFNILPETVGQRPYLAGIMGTRPSSTNAARFGSLLDTWRDIINDTEINPWPLSYYDAVHVYARAMHRLLETDGAPLDIKAHNCRQVPAVPWSNGDRLYRYLTEVVTEGVMRDIQFKEDGSPLHAAYDIVRLTPDTWEQKGQWTDEGGLTLNVSGLTGLSGRYLYDIRDYVGDLVNKTLDVVTVVDAPFVFRAKNTELSREDVVCGPEACFYGYAIDLLLKLSKELRFSFVIREVPDGKYGRSEDVTKEWNGLIGMLASTNDRKPAADLGVGSITISSERQSVISFTKPYRDLQLGIMLGTSNEQNFNPWSFLTPLSYELWGLIAGTAIVVGLVITCTDKLSPYGHHGMKAQVDGQHEHEAMDMNDDGTVDYWEMKDWQTEKYAMSFPNSALWSLASLFQQGGERHPKCWSARMAAGAWWFGVLIITASYTANLAAFLTIRNSSDKIFSIEDLAFQRGIEYGTIRDSQVEEFFDTTTRDQYKRIADNMRKWDKNFNNTETAVNHTIKSKGTYALLYDLPGLYYWKGQDCSLKVVRNGFSNIGYGFAMPKHSPYAEELTIQIYQLRESGYMDTLDEKWLVKTSLCAEGSGGVEIEESTVQIGMPSLWGVFWIIYVGFGLSFLFVTGEWLLSAASAVNAKNPKAPKTFEESVRRRLQTLKQDFLENWLVNFHRKEIKKQEQAMRPLPAALKAAILLKMRSSRLKNLGAAAAAVTGTPESAHRNGQRDE